ncbi:MAG: SDR family NAD(P)-dependent oxidoreductase [Acidimicrobiales bacterium]
MTQLDEGAWERCIDLNLTGTQRTLKHGGASLVRRGGGSFVAISSIAALLSHPWFGAYGPTLRRGPSLASALEPLFGADGLRGVVSGA